MTLNAQAQFQAQAEGAPLISLEQARELVQLLEMQQVEEANNMIRNVSPVVAGDLFAEIGKLTRQLHQSITHFEVDPRLSSIANQEMADAAEHLNHVIDMTERAANRTMDAVEECFPLLDKTTNKFDELRPAWKQLMNRDIALGEFKDLCHGVDTLLEQSSADAEQLKAQLTDVLMAQDYQDLTGQVIRRVITLVHEVEDKLVKLLSEFGSTAENTAAVSTTATTTANAASVAAITAGMQEATDVVAEGPILNAEQRDDVVSGQDDVDDLLSSLGF